MLVLWMMLGCSAECDEGFKKASDGNCYPTDDNNNGTNDNGGAGVPGFTGLRPDDPDTGRRFDTGRRGDTTRTGTIRTDDTSRRDDTGRRSSNGPLSSGPRAPRRPPGLIDAGLSRFLDCGGSAVQFGIRGDAAVAQLDVIATSEELPLVSHESHTLMATAMAVRGPTYTQISGPIGGLACADEGSTFALRVYDLDGQLMDCAMWGHNPEAVLFDGVEVAGAIPHGAELATCRVIER